MKPTYLSWLIPALAIAIFVGMIPFLSAFAGFALFIIWGMCILMLAGMIGNAEKLEAIVRNSITVEKVDNTKLYMNSAILLAVLLLAGHLATAIAAAITVLVVWVKSDMIIRKAKAEKANASIS